jgi:glycosyl transferase family 1
MTEQVKVCLFNSFPSDIHLPGYQIDVCDPFAQVEPSRHFRITDFISGGRESYSFRSRLYSAAGVDRLYRQRDPLYMRLAEEFVERAQHCDILILANYNPLHPEILFHELKKPIKVLGFVDDPASSYTRGVPYLWAVDGAFYISPSYDEHHSFPQKMQEWGVRESIWWPLIPFPFARFEPTDAFFHQRDIDLLYVGRAYGAKIDRLAQLKRRFGKRFRIYGQWPFGGYHGVVRSVLLGKPVLWARVRPVTSQERTNLYLRTRIGINMHLSEVPRETGNMRMYEIPAHGAMLLCDKAGGNAHEAIFRPDAEAVYYDDMDDAIAKAEFFLAQMDERVRIAKAGFKRLWCDYDWSTNLKMLLDWAWELRNTRATRG